MADFAVRDNIFADFNSHRANNDNSVFKFFEIAVPDYSTGAIKWEKIASIKALQPQHVYDLSIEGTKNFIANDIVAHNTYLATASGNVGIGKTNPNYKLDVAGTINASGLLLTNGTFSIGTGGRIGIGTANPNTALHVIGNVTINDSTRQNSIFIDSEANAILFEGENGSLYQPVYGTDDGLVLYLPFSENTINVSNKTYDRSPYGNDGLLVNMNYGNTTDELNNTGWAPGKYGNAIKFDGIDDYVDLGDTVSLKNSTAVTIEAWTKFRNNPLSNMGFVGKDNSYQLRADGNGVYFYIKAQGTETNSAVAGSSALNDDSWHYFVGTYDGTTMNLYMDGALSKTNAHGSGGALDGTTTAFEVGRRTTKYFNGTIDEVKIYSRVLAPEEIRTHYLRGSGFGVSGAITADKFRVVNTSGARTLEINTTAFDVKANSGSSALYVDKVNNRVGIGTTAPNDILEAVGNVRVSGSLNATSINTTKGAYFATSSGNVGIGTTNPASKLEVAGTFNATQGTTSLRVTSDNNVVIHLE